MISPRLFLRSLRHALRGLREVFRSEHSFRVQCLAAAGVLIVAFILPLATWQRIVLMLLSGGVLILETVNTILERLADAVQPRLSGVVRDVKDMMAGAVLIASLVAGVVGVMVFWPYLARLLAGLQSMLY